MKIIIFLILVSFSIAINQEVINQIVDSMKVKAEDKDAVRQFVTFLFSDQKIQKQLMSGGSASEETNKKVLNWMTSNDKYLELMVREAQKDQSNEWINKLNNQAKKRFIKITLNELSKDKNFNILNRQKESITEEQTKSLSLKYLEDKQIGTVLVNSFDWKQIASDQQAMKIKNSNPAFKNYNMKDLTIDQKIQLIKFFINHNPDQKKHLYIKNFSILHHQIIREFSQMNHRNNLLKMIF